MAAFLWLPSVFSAANVMVVPVAALYAGFLAKGAVLCWGVAARCRPAWRRRCGGGKRGRGLKLMKGTASDGGSRGKGKGKKNGSYKGSG